MTAATYPDFSIKSPYLFPGETPAEPVRIDVSEIAREVYESYIKPRVASFDAAAAPPVFSAKSDNRKPFKLDLASASKEPSWLARLLQFIKEFIVNISRGVAQKLGVQGEVEDGLSGGGGDVGNKIDAMKFSGAENNPAVAGEVLETALDKTKEFFEDEALLQSLVQLAKADPQAFEKELSDVFSRIDEKLKDIDRQLAVDVEKYESSLKNAVDLKSPKGMSALKMDSYLREGSAGKKFIPESVIVAFDAMAQRQDLRSRLAGSVAAMRSAFGQVAPEKFDQVLARYPQLLAVSQAAFMDNEKMQAAVRANVSTANARSACAVGPVVIPDAAPPKFGGRRASASSAMSMDTPTWGEDDLMEFDPSDATIERPRVG